jgi:hypothetical protein
MINIYSCPKFTYLDAAKTKQSKFINDNTAIRNVLIIDKM